MCHAGTANTFCSHVTWKTRNQDAHYFISNLYSITHKLILSARRMVNYHSIRYRLACLCPEYLYYKRRHPYLCSAKAPVLEGSGSRRLYHRKGTSVDRVCVVFGARVDLGFCYYSSKRIRGGSTYAECNSGPLNQHNATGATSPLSHCHPWLGATQ